MSVRERLAALHAEALSAVHGGRAVARALAVEPIEGPVALLACGKAALAMAQGAIDALGERALRGHVTAPEPLAGSLARCVVREGSHPLPDARSERAAREAIAFAGALGERETLLVLLSGGASALWTLPAEGISLADKRGTTDLLLRSAAEIGEVNAVRKHLSAIKGGRLAQAARGARSLTLALSDVRGDAPDVIGSGPTVADRSTFGDALRAIDAHDLRARIPSAAAHRLEAGARGQLPETLKPGDPALERASFRVIASLATALVALERAGRDRGLSLHAAGATLYGEVSTLVEPLLEVCRRARAAGARLVVAGGEPTVRVRGPGSGGRAQELALRFALALERERLGEWTALFASTDGRDGPTDAAGAFADSGLPARARALGLDPELCLAQSDSHALLARAGALHRTGPTHTNVSDLALVALDPAAIE